MAYVSVGLQQHTAVCVCYFEFFLEAPKWTVDVGISRLFKKKNKRILLPEYWYTVVFSKTKRKTKWFA